jgi:hypothetical protein
MYYLFAYAPLYLLWQVLTLYGTIMSVLSNRIFEDWLHMIMGFYCRFTRLWCCPILFLLTNLNYCFFLSCDVLRVQDGHDISRRRDLKNEK